MNLSTKTIEELQCALATAGKFISDIDKLGENFSMNLQLGGWLELELDTALARELIVKRQGEIIAELQCRRDQAARATGCTCECTCGKG